MRMLKSSLYSVDFIRSSGCNGIVRKPLIFISRFLTMLILVIGVEGCYTTALRVESQPPGATVYYDFKPVGKTPVEFNVDWYGKHKLTLEHPQYGRLEQIINLKNPAYVTFPFDLIATIAPAKIKDNHTITFDLSKQSSPKTEEDHGSTGKKNSTPQ